MRVRHFLDHLLEGKVHEFSYVFIAQLCEAGEGIGYLDFGLRLWTPKPFRPIAPSGIAGSNVRYHVLPSPLFRDAAAHRSPGSGPARSSREPASRNGGARDRR